MKILPLPKQYNSKETEKKWQKEWEEQGIYRFDFDAKREENFIIDTPPPTVSGLLHMGHIFSYTQADFVARFQRMRGKNVFYPMGFDDNGLPTERLVEKTKKIRATDMPREDFIKLCQEVVLEAENDFRQLFKTISLSVDWSQEYQTISTRSRAISQRSFLDLAHKNEAYRKDQPMFWDPIDQTAIAQAEMEDKELPSHMNYIKFGVVEDESAEIIIATTRPELLAACVAVFFHPEDERYKHLAGKTAVTALFGAKVPLLADEDVKVEKGTGLVMCCTFGDEMDINWWRKHNLPLRIILNKYGKLDLSAAKNQWLPELSADLEEALSGKKVTNAREIILEIIKNHSLLIKQDQITHAVKCAERSGAPLEIIPTPQWFIRVLPHKAALKEKSRECNWHPDWMRLRMEQWIDGLSWDWCISRQRYFGVPFPVWYSKRSGEEGKILYAQLDQLPVNPLIDLPIGYNKDEVEPDFDVMDTWATSSISPQLSSHWGENPERHAKLFPADMRPQAHEIIRTWAFYTLVKSYLHENSIPWKHLMISGWCLASDKTKMSKSKGNVVTPTALIEEKSADAVRYWASTSRLGMDTAFSEDVLGIGKKLVTKLWNATQFAAIHLEKLKEKPNFSATQARKNGLITETLDHWILSRLQQTIAASTSAFEEFEYCDARVATEQFFWKDFCDNYLEMIKVRVYGENSGISTQATQSAVYTLYYCLDGILRLFAPFVPHVTEELYTHIFAEHADLLNKRGAWPNAEAYPNDISAEKTGAAAVLVLDAVRKAKADKNLSLKTAVKILSISQNLENLLQSALADLSAVTQAEKIQFSDLAESDWQHEIDEHKIKLCW
jgi:valyl-tRNA synthetase